MVLDLLVKIKIKIKYFDQLCIKESVEKSKGSNPVAQQRLWCNQQESGSSCMIVNLVQDNLCGRSLNSLVPIYRSQVRNLSQGNYDWNGCNKRLTFQDPKVVYIALALCSDQDLNSKLHFNHVISQLLPLPYSVQPYNIPLMKFHSSTRSEQV